MLDQLKLVWKTKVTSHNIFVFSCLSSEMWETLKCFVESRKKKNNPNWKNLKIRVYPFTWIWDLVLRVSPTHNTPPSPPPKTNRLPNGVTPGIDTCQCLFHKCVPNRYDPRDFKSFSSKEGHNSFISLKMSSIYKKSPSW